MTQARTWKKPALLAALAAAVIAILAVAALSVGSAFAHRGGNSFSSAESSAELAENAAPKLERAVENGTITQDQADEISEWLGSAPAVTFEVRTRVSELDSTARSDLRSAVKDAVSDLDFNLKAAIAEDLGVDADDLEDAFQDNRSSRSRRGGYSLAGVAEALGVTEEALTDSISSVKQAHSQQVRAITLDELENAGVLSAAEANSIQEWRDDAPSVIADEGLFKFGKAKRAFGKRHRDSRHSRGNGNDADSGTGAGIVF